jgi:hypothetical protein
MSTAHSPVVTQDCYWIDDVEIRESEVFHCSRHEAYRFFEVRLYENDSEIGQARIDSLRLLDGS